jgi:4-amino-4-deoxy-L-arabinose transferase-like glycosyltransferase
MVLPAVLLSVFAGIRPLGVDGFVLLATLAVVGSCVAIATRRPDLGRTNGAPGADADARRPDTGGRVIVAVVPVPMARPGRRAARRRRSGVLTELNRPAVGLPVMAGAMLLVVAGQRSLNGARLTKLGVGLWLAGLLAVAALDRAMEAARPRSAGAMAATAGTARAGGWSGGRRTFLAGAAIAGVFVWSAMRRGPDDAGHGGVAVLWLLSMVAAVLAACWPVGRPSMARFRARLAAHRWEVAIVAGLTLGALALRVVALDRYPRVMSGDEGSFAMSAVAVLEGRLRNPFATGWLGHPTLYFYLQAGTMAVFGENVAGARLASALLGTAAVPMTYLLVRRHCGIATATAAAALLAAFHFHLILSRIALNNVGDTFFVVAALYFLDGGLLGGSRIEGLLAGLAVGLSQYFYASARLLPLVAVAYLGYGLVVSRPRSLAALRQRARRVLPSAAWMALGAVLAALPIYAYYDGHRADYLSRINQVSVFASGWLDKERARTGQGALPILWGQFARAALIPFHTSPLVYYRTDPPFVGGPLAIPVAIGIAVATVGAFRRRYFGLAVTFWATVVGLALTEGPPQTTRYAIAAPLLCVFAAIGVAVLAGAAATLGRARRALVGVAVAAAAVVGVGWNMWFYFDETGLLDRYSDTNMQVANRLADELRPLGPGYTVYFAAPPRMYYDGNANLVFIARNAKGIDVTQPWSATDAPPTLTGPTLFVFLPERRGELVQVERWFPNGTLADYATARGEPLYTAYRVVPIPADTAAPVATGH